MKNAIILCLLLITAVALVACSKIAEQTPPATPFQGGISGGGGDFIRTTSNPWFIQTTEEVNYCITVGAAEFPTDLEAIVKKAIARWQKVFEKANQYPTNYFHVGTQNFVPQVDCEKADLVFNFGRMTNEIAPYLTDPKRNIAQAIRLHYDEKTLKGKGVIYIAPDSNHFDPATKLPHNRWKVGEGIALYWVLAHELGHVFGIPHLRFYKMSGAEHIMAETFPEYVLNNVDHLKPGNFDYFFNNVFTYSFERNPEQLLEVNEPTFFGLGNGRLGLHWKSQKEAKVFFLKNEEETATEVGSLRINDASSQTSNGIYLWLPTGNDFEQSPSMTERYVMGPRFVREEYSAKMELSNGHSLSVLIATDPLAFFEITVHGFTADGIVLDAAIAGRPREMMIPR